MKINKLLVLNEGVMDKITLNGKKLIKYLENNDFDKSANGKKSLTYTKSTEDNSMEVSFNDMEIRVKLVTDEKTQEFPFNHKEAANAYNFIAKNLKRLDSGKFKTKAKGDNIIARKPKDANDIRNAPLRYTFKSDKGTFKKVNTGTWEFTPNDGGDTKQMRTLEVIKYCFPTDSKATTDKEGNERKDDLGNTKYKKGSGIIGQRFKNNSNHLVKLLKKRYDVQSASYKGKNTFLAYTSLGNTIKVGVEPTKENSKGDVVEYQIKSIKESFGRNDMKIDKLLESKKIDDYITIREINWLKDNPGESIKKTHYSVSYDNYIDANTNEPMGGHFTVVENRGRDHTRVDDVQELKDYIVRRYNRYFEESISSNEPAVKFQGKSSHTFTKDKKWEVDFDEAGNILARTRHGKPSYFKGHIDDKVNDFPSTDEDNIILAAREQHGLKFGDKEVKEGYSHFEFTSGSNPYIAKTKDEAERIKRSRGDSARYVGSINGIDYYKIDDGEEKDLFRVEEGYELSPRIDYNPNHLRDDEGKIMADRWYASKWPDDEVGIEQLQGITLDDALKNRKILDHCDTQVRERVYAQLDKYIPLSVDSPMYKEKNESTEQGLTYEELMELARKNYNKGGDSVYECWGKEEFDEYVKEFGPITKEKAYKLFGMYDEVNRDRDGYMIESKATHCVYFSMDGGKTQEIEFEGTEDECQDYIEKQEADNEFGDEAPERFVKRLTEGHFSDDDVEDDIEHANLYGGDTMYCRDCGTKKKWDDGYSYCPKCNNELEEAHYGGAFDIADDQYFTRDDLLYFADEVLGNVAETFEGTFDIGGVWFENGCVVTQIVDDEGNMFEDTTRVDMRKIKEPWHLRKAYSQQVSANIIKQIKELNGMDESVASSSYEFDDDVDNLSYYYSEEDIIDALNDVWEEKASKSVSDSNGFMTDYTMYRNINTGEYVFVFGDKDIYRPEDGYYDWECETEEEAEEWFNNYHGFEDSEFDDFEESYEVDKVFSAACNNRMDYMKKGFEKGRINPNDRFNRFNSDHSYIMGALRNGNKDMVKYLQDQGGTILDDEQDEYNRLIGEEVEKSPIVHKKNDGSYMVANENGDGYVAYNKSDVCIGNITTSNENEAKSKFNSNQFDE